MTTWTSLRRPLAKVGRSGRSIRRQVRIASSDGRPSRRKNEPGMRPAAYIRSSTSTVSGKKSNCSLGWRPAVVADSSMVSPMGGDDGAGGLTGEPAGLEGDGAAAEAAVVDDRGGGGDAVLGVELGGDVLVVGADMCPSLSRRIGLVPTCDSSDGQCVW